MNSKWNGKTKSLWIRTIKFLRFGEWFDPHQSFLRLPAFWVPFILIVTVFCFLCWKVSIDEHLIWGSPIAKIDELYDWFKVPFWVLALLIPVIGLFNANHKSEQAKATMELTRSQNNFANYYKHLEEFQRYMDFSKDSSVINYTRLNKRRMHKALFPKADAGVLQLKKPILDTYCDFLTLFIDLIFRVARGEHLQAEVKTNIREQRKLLSLEIGQIGVFQFSLEFGMRTTPSSQMPSSPQFKQPSVKKILVAYHSELDFVYQALSFDTLFDEDGVINRINKAILLCLNDCFEIPDHGLVDVSTENQQLAMSRLEEAIDELADQRRRHPRD